MEIIKFHLNLYSKLAERLYGELLLRISIAFIDNNEQEENVGGKYEDSGDRRHKNRACPGYKSSHRLYSYSLREGGAAAGGLMSVEDLRERERPTC